MTTKIKIRSGEWVLVCDGRKALILQNKGDEVYPQLVVSEVFEQKADATRAYGSDAPGRVHQVTGAKSAVEQTDWHDQMEQQFIRRLSDHLDTLVASKTIESIVVVAPPRALGVLRSTYSAGLRHAIKNEVAKDLVALSAYKIEQALTA